MHSQESQRLYWIWCDMRFRCKNKNHKAYKNYGGRGIDVCEAWKKSFQSFIDDMGDRPSPKHSLDRIDNNKGYYPDNCRWATRKEQNLNKRKYANNKTGEKNIEFRGLLFRVRIRREGKIVANGQFPDIKSAKQFRDSEVIKYAQH